MARAALGWGVRELAAWAGVAANTVSRYENGTEAHAETLRKLSAACEKAGLRFIEADEEGGIGVRFKR